MAKPNQAQLNDESYGFVMPDDAYALQPVRFMPNDQLRYYTAITFPKNPRGGCDMYRRRCEVFGGIAKSEADATGICDILDEHGNIIADFWLNRKGLNYLYRALGCRVEKNAGED